MSNEYKDSFRERVRNFRIIYQIDGFEIKILTIGHRKSVYIS
ncbi:MAG: type II toxin-antitoxin system RelE family toxin [Methanobacteriaceae archaeon]